MVREIVLDRLVCRSNRRNGGSLVIVLALMVAAELVVRLQLNRLPDLHLTMRRCHSCLVRRCQVLTTHRTHANGRVFINLDDRTSQVVPRNAAVWMWLLDRIDVGGSVLLNRKALMEDSGAFGDLLCAWSVNFNGLLSAYSHLVS